MATRQWAVTTSGTFGFNDPANWQFRTAPGIFDIAQFNQNVDDTVTGNATYRIASRTAGSQICFGVRGWQP